MVIVAAEATVVVVVVVAVAAAAAAAAAAAVLDQRVKAFCLLTNCTTVCTSIDIRNDIKNFRKLENCTVIEGHLQISLIEHVTKEDYKNYRFPQLLEITDYVLLYRVYGLTTLRDMFPNLAVIRGRLLFTNFALVAFEMIDLEELGLINLQNISRGGVRLAKNKKLCFINTVDWEKLGVSPGEQDFKQNREENACVNLCQDECTETTVGRVTAGRCWTSSHCQKNLSESELLFHCVSFFILFKLGV
ncbi:insulin receptor [Elysia marginata]|uniref:Insulin receptor n=1 Tax=Elysia marginata TaxID=1093978 RepID=A0AAV4HUW5_9GAST|nr:insulin receptor [Elysia marginata]